MTSNDDAIKWLRDDGNRAAVYVSLILATAWSCLTGFGGEHWIMVVGFFWLPIFFAAIALAVTLIIFPLVVLGHFCLAIERQIIRLCRRHKNG